MRRQHPTSLQSARNITGKSFDAFQQNTLKADDH